MSKICACHCCFDPRESGFFAQHGIQNPEGVYQSRGPGGLQARENSMLVERGMLPDIDMVQGHTDCVAVKGLLDTTGRPTHLPHEQAMLKTHGRVLQEVNELANLGAPDYRREILEMACVAESVNNKIAAADAGFIVTAKHRLAYLSLTPPVARNGAVPKAKPANDVPLAIYDPTVGRFVMPADGMDIRLGNMMKDDALLERFSIMWPIDTAALIKKELGRLVHGREMPVAVPLARGENGLRRGAARPAVRR
jgi:hypothetical protein